VPTWLKGSKEALRVALVAYLQSIGLWCVQRINSTDFTTVFRDFVGDPIANRSIESQKTKVRSPLGITDKDSFS